MLIHDLYRAFLSDDFSLLNEHDFSASNIRAIISTEKHEGAEFSVVTENAPWIIPAIKGPRYFFHSKDMLAASLGNNGRSAVPIDWSFSFDSSVASKIKAYIYNKTISEPRIKTLLDIKRGFKLQTDLMPYLLENLTRYSLSAREPIVKTIAAFKSLDYIDWNKYDQNYLRPFFLKDFSLIEKEAEAVYNHLVHENEIKSQQIKQNFLYAFLLELAIQWMKNKNDINAVFSKLIDFSVIDLGKVPLYELSLAWYFLQNSKNTNAVRFFGPILGSSHDLHEKLKGMAWDIRHVRTLETMTTSFQNQAFFLSFFISFDNKLLDIINVNKIIFVLIDDENQIVQSGRELDLDTQLAINENISGKAKEKLNEEDSSARIRRQLDEDKIKNLVTKKENELSNLL